MRPFRRGNGGLPGLWIESRSSQRAELYKDGLAPCDYCLAQGVPVDYLLIHGEKHELTPCSMGRALHKAAPGACRASGRTSASASFLPNLPGFSEGFQNALQVEIFSIGPF